VTQRLPADSFEYYVALGDGRSYTRVAEHYGVAKRTVTRHALVEDWTSRLLQVEAESRAKSDAKLAETLAEMRERHMKTLRAINARALAALREFPISSSRDAVRAAEMVIKMERLIAGEPTERHANVEEIMRREMDALLVYDDDDDDADEVHADAPR